MHHIVSHPFVQHKLTVLRDKNTRDKEFRELANEVTMLLAYEALKHVSVEDIEVETPLASMRGKRVRSEIVLVPVLRAGVGMLQGILNLIPTARVGFVGLYRDPDTKQPIEYYAKFPTATDDGVAIIIDPMLATGGSINATITLLKEHSFRNILVISIIAAPEGMAAVEEAHPDVTVYTGAVDDHLDERKYIIPGLGDAGDRLFGTR